MTRPQLIEAMKRDIKDRTSHHERSEPISRRLVHLVCDQLVAESGMPKKRRAYNRRFAR